MLKLEFTSQFKKDYKLAVKRGCNIDKFQEVITLLCNETPLPKEYLDHPLLDSKHFRGVRECHISPDWLLVYKVQKDRLILQLIRTDTHSDLFKK